MFSLFCFSAVLKRPSPLHLDRSRYAGIVADDSAYRAFISQPPPVIKNFRIGKAPTLKNNHLLTEFFFLFYFHFLASVWKVNSFWEKWSFQRPGRERLESKHDYKTCLKAFWKSGQTSQHPARSYPISKSGGGLGLSFTTVPIRWSQPASWVCRLKSDHTAVQFSY